MLFSLSDHIGKIIQSNAYKVAKRRLQFFVHNVTFDNCIFFFSTIVFDVVVLVLLTVTAYLYCGLVSKVQM